MVRRERDLGQAKARSLGLSRPVPCRQQGPLALDHHQVPSRLCISGKSESNGARSLPQAL